MKMRLALALVLKLASSWLMESGVEPGCNETISIAFDSNQKASVQSVKQDK
jgi:hypothetical protein